MPLDPRHGGAIAAPQDIAETFDTELRRSAMPHEEAAVEEKIDNYGAFKRIARGWKSGALQIESGEIDYRIMEMDQPTPELLEQQKAMEDELTELGQDGTGFTSWVTKAARIAGQQYGLATGAQRHAVEAFTESQSPLEFATRIGKAAQEITQPAVGFAMTSFRSSTGDSYTQLIKQGIDPNTARMAAFTTGTLISALDAAGAVGTAAPITLAAKNLIKSQVAKVATSPKVLAMAGRVVAAYGGAIASEVPTEVLQEGIQIAAEELGKKLTSEELASITEEEIYERIESVAVETLKGMVILAIPGGSMQIGVEANRVREARRLREVLDESKKALDEAADPVVAVQQFVEALDENEVKEFFISADAIVEAAQKSGDPAAFYAELGVGNQIEEAALLGGDVRMDVPRGVALMQSDQWDLLKDHIRLTYEAMSPFEEQELKESGLDEEIEAAGETIAEPEFVTLEEGRAQGLDKFGEPNEAGVRELVGIPAVSIDGQTFTGHDHTSAIDAATTALGPEIVARIDADPEQFVGYTKRPEQQAQEQLNEEQFGLQGFFKDAKDAGMTDKQYETYLVSLQKAADSKNSAKERIRLRKLESETREEIKTIKAQLAEVARESVDNQPVYGAINALEGHERLNKEKLESLGIDPVALPKARGRQIYEKGGTVDPEIFAELWGFEGPDIMAFSMMDAPPREAAIAQETERLFNERYVGLTQKQQEIEADIEALHNDSQAAVIALELNQLREAIGQKKLKPRLMKIAARDRLRDFPLKEINPKKYLAAEQREARTAAKLLRKGDRQGAAKAKFRQLLNFQFAMEAYRVREKTKSQHKYLKKFSKRAKPNAKLPIDYFLAIQTMLGEIDLKRSRPSLVDFVVSKQINEGIVLNIPMQVQVDNGKTSYLDLSLRRWEQMVETVKEVEKKGLDENKFLREQEKQTRDEAATEVALNVRTNLKMRQGEELGTRWDEAKKFGRDMALLATNTDSLVREVDGFASLGPAHNYIKRPYNLAMTTGYHPGQIGFIAREQKESKRLVKLVDVFTKSEQLGMKKRIVIPGVKSSKMSHERVIMTLMNAGNLENRKALVDGGPLTDPEVDAIIAYASKKDWDFVQSIWDYFEEFWPEVVESSKRRRNVVPTKVEATPIETPHGTYRGGYFPLMYSFHEVAMTELATTGDVAKLLEVMRTGRFEQSQTKHGHTLEREASGKRQVKLDLFNINAHLNQVVYDLEVGDAVMDIFKIIRAPAVRDAFKETGNSQRWEALNLWFGDIVLGEQHFHDGWSRLWRHLRTGFTISKIGFNLMTVALQPLGLVNTMAQVGKQNTLTALMSAMFNPRAAFYIGQQTPFMQQRSATYNHDIIAAQQAFKASMLRKVTPGNSAEVAGRWSFYALIKMQRVVDTITWMAAKRKGMVDFRGDEAKANEYADNMVARSQSSGMFGYRTPLERGTTSRRSQQNELTKLMVPLMSYYLAKANVAYERIRRTNPRSPLQVIDLAVDLSIMTIGEALLAAMIMGDWPDDEDDLLGFVGFQWVKSAAAMVPGARDVVSVAEGFTGGGVPASVMAEMGAFFQQASQGEMDAAFYRSLAKVTGTLARIPGTSQAIRTSRAVEAGSENPIEYVTGPPYEN